MLAALLTLIAFTGLVSWDIIVDADLVRVEVAPLPRPPVGAT